MTKPLRLLTRKSPLAMWQAESVQAAMNRLSLPSVLQGVVTEGDQKTDQPLYELGGKSLFIKAIEQALLRGDGDVAVHSLKDMTAIDEHGLVVLPFAEREDPRDALVTKDSVRHWDDLPQGAVIGTSSLRRAAMIKVLRPDIKTQAIRGNVATRIRQCDEGKVDAVILAAAGLHRLGLQSRISSYFSVDDLLPSSCQGIIAIQCKVDDQERLQPLVDPVVMAQAVAERAVCSQLGASCQTPIGVHAQVDGEQMHLQAVVLSRDGQQSCRADASGMMHDAKQLAEVVCQQLLADGVGRLL